jgi:hypothetical protein
LFKPQSTISPTRSPDLRCQEKVGLSPATTNIVMAAIPLVLAPLSFVAQRIGDIFGEQCYDNAESQTHCFQPLCAVYQPLPMLPLQGGCRQS